MTAHTLARIAPDPTHKQDLQVRPARKRAAKVTPVASVYVLNPTARGAIHAIQARHIPMRCAIRDGVLCVFTLDGTEP